MAAVTPRKMKPGCHCGLDHHNARDDHHHNARDDHHHNARDDHHHNARDDHHHITPYFHA